MKPEISVPEAVNIFREIKEQPDKLYEMIRTGIRETIGQYLSTSLKDFYHRPFEPEINEAAKAWVVNSACTGPEDHGLAAELRILNGPAKYTRSHAPPKHGSWLNLTETVFSKMARTFLRHIRVSGKEELKERILRGIKEINAGPAVYRWKKFDLGIV